MNQQQKKKIITAIANVSVCVVGASFLFSFTLGNKADSIAMFLNGQNVTASMEDKRAASQIREDVKGASSASTSTTTTDEKTAPKALVREGGVVYTSVEELNSKGQVTGWHYVVMTADKELDEEITIKDKIEGYSVLAIGPKAFYNRVDIKSVVIPKTVKTIGLGAFKGCRKLEKVTMPDSLGSTSEVGVIENEAFSGCYALKEIKLPSNVTRVAESTFYQCVSLEKVSWSKQIEAIDKRAFVGCMNLTGLDKLPSTLTTIGEAAFAYCDSAKKVTIPKSVDTIGNYAFAACKNLTEFTVETGNKVYTAIDGNLYRKEETAGKAASSTSQGKEEINEKATYKVLMQYALGKTGKSFTLPKGVGMIESAAFALANNLTDVELGADLKIIKENAFYGCAELTNVKFGEALLRIGENAFRNCNKLTDFVLPVPEKSNSYDVTTFKEMDIYNYAFRWCDSLEKVFISGDYEDWKLKVNLGLLTGLDRVEVYFYSEEAPTEEGNYWRYVDGQATIWGEEEEEIPEVETTPEEETEVA